jgi:hypothetical protein
MNLHPNAAYSLHREAERLHERTLRDRRLASDAAPVRSLPRSTETVRTGIRRGFAVAAATGVLVVAALSVVA